MFTEEFFENVRYENRRYDKKYAARILIVYISLCEKLINKITLIFQYNKDKKISMKEDNDKL